MMRRLRQALLRDISSQTPQRPLRPNELRRDVAREERLRREARRIEPLPNRQGPSLEEQRARPASPSVPPAAPARAASPHVSALKTHSGLRQAWLLKEILGPPVGLRGHHSDIGDV
jgi:hypothetical protein